MKGIEQRQISQQIRNCVLTANMGPDAGMGILHADLKSRDSFVFYLIEPLRPLVDGYLLTTLEERTFTAREFFETRQGVCRLMPPLPQALAEMAPRLAKLVAPVVEQVAQRLSKGQGTTPRPLTVPRLITQSNRRAGSEGVRTTSKRTAKSQRLVAQSGCRECGVVFEDRSRQYCDACLPNYQEAQSTSFSNAGGAKLPELRASGIDPSQTGDASKKRRATMIQRHREERAWEVEHGRVEGDEATFRSEILPGLQGLSLTQIAEAAGWSQQYCSLIRRGLKVPHPRHCESLRELEHLTSEKND